MYHLMLRAYTMRWLPWRGRAGFLAFWAPSRHFPPNEPDQNRQTDRTHSKHKQWERKQPPRHGQIAAVSSLLWCFPAFPRHPSFLTFISTVCAPYLGDPGQPYNSPPLVYAAWHVSPS